MGSRWGVPGRYSHKLHDNCLKNERKNNVCSECKFFKQHGERLGFPDINPWSYRAHLDPSDLPLVFPPIGKYDVVAVTE